MKKLIEICAGHNCSAFADKIERLLGGLEDSSFKIIKTTCSKNCGNRFGPPVIRINGDVFQGEVVLQKLPEIISFPKKFISSFERKVHISGGLQELSGRPGLAIDIGTTNIKVALADIDAKAVIATASSLNGQVAYGPTVIDRIFYFSKNKDLPKEDELRIIQRVAVRTINEIIRQLLKRCNLKAQDIKDICVAGNTVMSYLFLGRDPDLFGAEDKPHYREAKTCLAAGLKLAAAKEARVVILPSVSEYIGGDIVSGIFSENLWPPDKNRLFIDLGTNGEVVLILKEPRLLLAASASAGPAFEGGGFRYGGYTVPGSITTASIADGKLTYETYEGVKAANLCGSGVLELLCELFQNSIIDKRGSIIPFPEIVRQNSRKGESGLEILVVPEPQTLLGEDITVTQNEVKYFIDSKAAIAATISTLLELAECEAGKIEEVLVAGGFGNLDFKKSVALGLLPNLPLERFKYLGNTSLAGAAKFLFSGDQQKISEIVSSATAIDFSSDPDCQKRFFDHYTKEKFIY